MIARHAVRWLLWSRRRLVLVVTATVLLAVVVSRGTALVTAHSPHDSVPAAAPVAAATTPSAPPAPTTLSGSPPTPTTSPRPTTPADEPDDDEEDADEDAGDDPRDIALQFARLWASPDTAPREWLRRLRPLSTPEFAATVLARVNPANVPASEVDGSPRRVQSPRGTAVFVVPFDTFEAQIELVATSEETGSGETGSGETTWRVTDLELLEGA